jgi:hypothetical protein
MVNDMFLDQEHSNSSTSLLRFVIGSLVCCVGLAILRMGSILKLLLMISILWILQSLVGGTEALMNVAIIDLIRVFIEYGPYFGGFPWGLINARRSEEEQREIFPQVQKSFIKNTPHPTRVGSYSMPIRPEMSRDFNEFVYCKIWSVIELIRNLSNVSPQFRDELGEIFWARTRVIMDSMEEEFDLYNESLPVSLKRDTPHAVELEVCSFAWTSNISIYMRTGRNNSCSASARQSQVCRTWKNSLPVSGWRNTNSLDSNLDRGSARALKPFELCVSKRISYCT